MSIQIEEGKSYRTSDGRKVGPMRRVEESDDGWCFDGVMEGRDAAWYTKNGECPHIPERDVVAEWVEEPEHNDLGAAVVKSIDVKAILADEAKSIVSGARRAAYGKPEDNFERIARFWQAYFANTGRGDVKLTAADISPLMRLMKEARLCETPDHRDSFVDLIGYALTGAEINKVDPQKSA